MSSSTYHIHFSYILNVAAVVNVVVGFAFRVLNFITFTYHSVIELESAINRKAIVAICDCAEEMGNRKNEYSKNLFEARNERRVYAATSAEITSDLCPTIICQTFVRYLPGIRLLVVFCNMYVPNIRAFLTFWLLQQVFDDFVEEFAFVSYVLPP
uniref:Uncharacterized protein n=1 Tax=Glossina brevipalpis TaxID=37001 RepID=A0A1A9WXY3_9MUSC